MAVPGDPNYRYSVNEYPTTGTQTNFEVSFAGGYISREYVKVRITDAIGDITYPAFEWVGDFTIVISPAPAAGGTLLIYRETPADTPIVDFTDGAIINEAALDINARQAVHLAAETRDITGSIPTLEALQSVQNALSYALSRSNHTGVQPIASVTGLQAALDTKISYGSTFIDPRRSGAIGNMLANDLGPMQTAFDLAKATGLPIRGGPVTYAVNGGLTVSSANGFFIEELSLKQIKAVNDINLRTIMFSGCDRVHISGLKINRGTGAAFGALNDSAAIYLAGGSGHRINGVEITGNGKGSTFVVSGTSASVYANVYCHDMLYDDATATDDQLQGILATGNYLCNFVTCQVRGLGGNGNVSFRRYTRGFAASMNNRCSFIGCLVADVDQGIDFSGSDGNVFCSIMGCIIDNPTTWGIKLANSAFGCVVSGCIITSPGLSGVVIQGPSAAGLPLKGEDILVTGCKVYNTGANGFAGAKAAFRVVDGGFDLAYPQNIRFVDCEAYDTQNTPTMQYGFLNSIAPNLTLQKFVTAVNCRSFRHTVAEISGFHYFDVSLSGIAPVSVLNTTPTVMVWDVERYDGCDMHDPAFPSRIRAPVRGWYKVEAWGNFALNANGARRVVLGLNGAIQSYTSRTFVANNLTQQCAPTQMEIWLEAGDYIEVTFEQSSGGALDLVRADSGFSMRYLHNVR